MKTKYSRLVCSGLMLKDQNSYAAGKTCGHLFKNTIRKQLIHAMTLINFFIINAFLSNELKLLLKFLCDIKSKILK